jgi:predicted lipoprotein with Yx(FWY)xxD motif
MQKFALVIAAAWMGSAFAGGITVSEKEITNKTPLVAVADVSLKGVKATILTDDKGISLYTFEIDKAGKSNCSGGCLGEWPPEHVPANTPVAAPFGTIMGNDGKPQLTLNGLPLYHYDDDKKPGDTFGQYPEWDAVLVTP